MRRILYLLFIVLALSSAVLACNLPNQNVIVVTATASLAPGQPSPTLLITLAAAAPTNPSAPTTPTPIPSATGVPTATAAPNVAIAEADSALRNGDYDAAVQIYRSILDRPLLSVDPKLRSNASLGLGTGALREGKFKDAVAALADLIQTYPTDIRLPQAYFLRGDAYL